MEECGRWLLYITDIFLPIVDSETGDWRHLPFHGSMMNQPYMTMQVLKLIQLNFRKHLAEKAESIRLKTGRIKRGIVPISAPSFIDRNS